MDIVNIKEGELKEGDYISFIQECEFSKEDGGDKFSVNKDTGALVEKLNHDIATLVVYIGMEIRAKATIKELTKVAKKIIFKHISLAPPPNSS